MRRFAQAFAFDDDGASRPQPLDPLLATMPSRYNIAKTKPAGIVHAPAGDAIAAEMIWGIVPRWSKLPETRYTTVTARLERAAKSRVFAQAWSERRCVVPMTGYFKWDRTRKPAWPHFITSRDGEPLFAAGLWERWDKGDTPLDTFSILTHANDAIPAPLVPDGPIFLTQAAALKWIAGRPWLPQTFLTGQEQPDLVAYPVSRKLRDPSRDDYTLLEPVDPDDDDAAAATTDRGGDDDEWRDDDEDDDAR